MLSNNIIMSIFSIMEILSSIDFPIPIIKTIKFNTCVSIRHILLVGQNSIGKIINDSFSLLNLLLKYGKNERNNGIASKSCVHATQYRTSGHDWTRTHTKLTWNIHKAYRSCEAVVWGMEMFDLFILLFDHILCDSKHLKCVSWFLVLQCGVLWWKRLQIQ